MSLKRPDPCCMRNWMKIWHLLNNLIEVFPKNTISKYGPNIQKYTTYTTSAAMTMTIFLWVIIKIGLDYVTMSGSRLMKIMATALNMPIAKTSGASLHFPGYQFCPGLFSLGSHSSSSPSFKILAIWKYFWICLEYH